MSAEPRAYALALAEGVTGQALVLQGYGPAVDALLQVAPPAALTPEAVAQGHTLVSAAAAAVVDGCGDWEQVGGEVAGGMH